MSQKMEDNFLVGRLVSWLVGFTAYQPFFGSFIAELNRFDKRSNNSAK